MILDIVRGVNEDQLITAAKKSVVRLLDFHLSGIEGLMKFWKTVNKLRRSDLTLWTAT
ncbi:hypothetical protein J437_LFUL000675 [Ladona fulva]|uniref:Uncharacterized protein n=1 Tax=Ladona fulva TaxID=123851 RepID=A0A8K0K3D5_LADFU|nr:hypothetical protein J437_LFUL000675 [Ladona fulva]